RRPASLGRGDAGGALAREAARASALRFRRLVATAGAERSPRVVRHLAGPDEIPEGGKHDLRLELGRGDEVVPELRTSAERGADCVVRLALRASRRARPAERGRVLAEVDGDPVEPRADPDNFAGRAQLVELSR